MFFKKSNPKCNKCGVENCANPYECKERVVKAFTNSPTPLSTKKLYDVITSNNFGKAIKLLKLNFSYNVSPDVGVYSALNNYDFYGMISVNYTIKWGDEMIDAPMWIRVVGELVFNDSWFESDNKSAANVYQRGDMYYNSDMHYMYLTLRAKEEQKKTVLELITRSFQGQESFPSLICKFKLPSEFEESSKISKLAVTEWRIGNFLYAKQGFNMDVFEWPGGCL